MRSRFNCFCLVVSMSIGILSWQSQAAATNTPGIMCKKDVTSGGTAVYGLGVGNAHVSQRLLVDCPVVLEPGTSRVATIRGIDNNPTSDFSCAAFGWDINLNTISMPTITARTGTYSLSAPIATFNVPDSAVKMTLACYIPIIASQNAESFIDFIDVR